MMKRSRFGCGVLALAALLGVPSAGSAQLTGVENGEWRYLGGDAGHTRSAPLLNQINASNFSDLQVAWIWRGGQLRAWRRDHVPIHAGLRGRRAVHGRRSAAAGGGDRRRHGRDALDLPGARDDQVFALAEGGLRKGRRLRGGGRTGRDLPYDARFLPLGFGRQDGAAPGELGHARTAGRFLPDRGRRSDTGPRAGLGALAELGRALRPGLRDSQAAGDDHQFVAPDRGERGGCGAQRPRTQLRPDPDRERPGRHYGLRRQNRKAALEVPRHPAARRGRPRHVGERRLAVGRATCRRGLPPPPTRSAGSCTS